MEVKDIPLVGSPDARNNDAINTTGRGQRFVSTVFDVIKNPVSGGGRVYVNKRPGYTNSSTFASGAAVALSDDRLVSIFDTTNGNVWHNQTTNCGSAGSQVFKGVTIAYIGGEKLWLITTSDDGYFLATGALSGASTFTANRTSGSPTLTSVSSFTGLYVGQLITGTGIPTGTRISAMDTGASTITMTANASSGAGTSTTVTRERIAKIIDPDFPSLLSGPMVEIDGYVFVAQYGTQKIYNSDQNSITSWGASNYLTLSSNSGEVAAIAKYRGRLIGFGANGFEWFYNSGNSTGSPFTRTGDSSGIGCYRSTEKAGSIWVGARTVVWGDDSVFFCGNDGGVYKLDGASAVKITDSVQSRLIPNDADLQKLSFVNYMGRKVLLSSTFAYDTELGLWYEHGLSGVFGGSEGALVDGTGAMLESNDIFYAGGTGLLRVTDPANPVYQENGSSYTMTIQTARIDFGTGNRKSILWMELDSDIQSSGTATLEISDDDAQNFTTIGTFDMTQDHPRIYRCGSYKGGINIRITHSANTAFRASTLRVCYTVGSI